jgi:hypothetical protein
MILCVPVKLKELYEQGREYLWPKVQGCPRCRGSRLWGHGYVPAYFEEYPSVFVLRRYRCADCRCVIRVKAEGYWARFRTSIETIRCCIRHRTQTGRYLPSVLLGRQGHWLRALKRKASAYLGDLVSGDLVEAFEQLIRMGKVPVGRSV